MKVIAIISAHPKRLTELYESELEKIKPNDLIRKQQRLLVTPDKKIMFSLRSPNYRNLRGCTLDEVVIDFLPTQEELVIIRCCMPYVKRCKITILM